MPDAYDRLRDSRVSRVSGRSQDTEQDAYHLGLRHGQAGMPVSKNPYDKHTPGQMTLHYQYKNGHEKGSSMGMKTEAKMSDAEMKKREEIVKSMKKNMAGFRQRYGERAKEVMYATATKQAMKEEAEDIEEASADPMAKRVTARKHMGDDAHSWAVFVDNKPFVTGLGKSEVNYHKQKALSMLKSKTVKEEAEELDESQKKIDWLKNMIKKKTEDAGWNDAGIYNRDWKKEVAAHKKELAALQKTSTNKAE